MFDGISSYAVTFRSAIEQTSAWRNGRRSDASVMRATSFAVHSPFAPGAGERDNQLFEPQRIEDPVGLMQRWTKLRFEPRIAHDGGEAVLAVTETIAEKMSFDHRRGIVREGVMLAPVRQTEVLNTRSKFPVAGQSGYQYASNSLLTNGNTNHAAHLARPALRRYISLTISTCPKPTRSAPRHGPAQAFPHSVLRHPTRCRIRIRRTG